MGVRVVGRNIMVHWCVCICMDWSMYSNIVVCIDIVCNLMFSIDNMILSVMSFEGFMDGLWVNMMFLHMSKIRVMSVIPMMGDTIAEWIIIGSLKAVIIKWMGFFVTMIPVE